MFRDGSDVRLAIVQLIILDWYYLETSGCHVCGTGGYGADLVVEAKRDVFNLVQAPGICRPNERYVNLDHDDVRTVGTLRYGMVEELSCMLRWDYKSMTFLG